MNYDNFIKQTSENMDGVLAEVSQRLTDPVLLYYGANIKWCVRDFSIDVQVFDDTIFDNKVYKLLSGVFTCMALVDKNYPNVNFFRSVTENISLDSLEEYKHIHLLEDLRMLEDYVIQLIDTQSCYLLGNLPQTGKEYFVESLCKPTTDLVTRCIAMLHVYYEAGGKVMTVGDIINRAMQVSIENQIKGVK